MKALLAASLLIGYLLLVPYCFFGIAMTMSLGDMGMGIHEHALGMTDCGMPGHPCSTTPMGENTGASHGEMYHSITNILLSTFLFFSLFAAVMFFVFTEIFGLRKEPLSTSCIRRIKEGDLFRVASRFDILSWLSLREMSPALF